MSIKSAYTLIAIYVMYALLILLNKRNIVPIGSTHERESKMASFKENTTYLGRFIGDADAALSVRVVKRTAKTVIFVHPHTGDETRAKVHIQEGYEFFFPLGMYSMAPVIRADRESEE